MSGAMSAPRRPVGPGNSSMMNLIAFIQRVRRLLLRRHRPVKSFEQELHSAGGIAGRVDAGTRTVDVRRVVGSVGRAETLRSDFFYKRGRAITSRFRRVGAAMQQGKELPPLELYKVKRSPEQREGAPAPQSEYYVVDGHHRVAMARKLGQDFLDAHVVEYRVGRGEPARDADALSSQEKASEPAPPPESADPEPRPEAAEQ